MRRRRVQFQDFFFWGGGATPRRKSESEDTSDYFYHRFLSAVFYEHLHEVYNGANGQDVVGGRAPREAIEETFSENDREVYNRAMRRCKSRFSAASRVLDGSGPINPGGRKNGVCAVPSRPAFVSLSSAFRRFGSTRRRFFAATMAAARTLLRQTLELE